VARLSAATQFEPQRRKERQVFIKGLGALVILAVQANFFTFNLMDDTGDFRLCNFAS
jgi:hypothetical protein